MLLTYSEIYTEIYSEIYSEIKTRSYFSLPSAYHKTTPAPNTLADFKTPETLKRQTYIYNCFRDFCIFDFHASFFALPRKSHESNNTKVPSKLQRERQQALQRKTYPNHILPTARAQQALQHKPHPNHTTAQRERSKRYNISPTKITSNLQRERSKRYNVRATRITSYLQRARS